MGIKFELTQSERTCVVDALELLVADFHEDNCSLEANRARDVHKMFAHREPHVLTETAQTALPHDWRCPVKTCGRGRGAASIDAFGIVTCSAGHESR